MAISQRRLSAFLLSAFLILAMAIGFPVRQASADTLIPVTTEAELISAIADASAGDIIGLANDILLSADLTINNNVTLASDLGTELNAGTHRIIVPAGSGVSFGGALGVTGSHTGANDGLVVVRGTLIIQPGAVCVVNSYTNTLVTNSSTIYVDGGTLDVQGGTITDNPSAFNNVSNAVYANGGYVVLTKAEGSSISIGGSGYGIYARNGADVSIYAGSVTGHCGISLDSSNEGGFIMHAGGNETVTGTLTGVYVHCQKGAVSPGYCSISGGTITAENGCGLEVSGMSAQIYGGSITGSTTDGGVYAEDGATLDVYRDSSLSITGGIRCADGSIGGIAFLSALHAPLCVLLSSNTSFTLDGAQTSFMLDAANTSVSLGASYDDSIKTVSLNPTAAGTNYKAVFKSAVTWDNDGEETETLNLTLPVEVTTAIVTIPVLNNVSRTNIGTSSATFSSGVYADGGGAVTEYGFVYSSTDDSPEIGENDVTTLSSLHSGEVSGNPDSFTANVTGLTPGATYYVRSYAKNSAGTGYTLLPSNMFAALSTPEVTTGSYLRNSDGLAWNQMYLYGNVTNEGASAVTGRGIVYTTVYDSSGPDTLRIGGENVTALAAATGGSGEYQVRVDGLTAQTVYYYRAYAINAAGTVYGAIRTISLGAIQIHVDTEDGGNIETPDGEVVNTRGALFYNGTTWVTNDTAAHMYFTDMETGERLIPRSDIAVSGSGTYSCENAFGTVAITVESGTYGYTADAMGGGRYSYTGREYYITAVYTDNEANITQTDHIVLRSRGVGNGTGSAYFDSFVQVDNGNDITAIRSDPNWITYSGMTMAQALAASEEDGTISGRFVTADADYYMDVNGGSDMGGRSYLHHTGTFSAVNTLDTSSLYNMSFSLRYHSGSEIVSLDFTPLLTGETYIPASTGGNDTGGAGRSSAPNVVTTAVEKVTIGGAALSGKVTSSGGARVTERGFVVGMEPDPVIGGANTIRIAAGSGTGSFGATADTLLPGTAYYVRAYAMNGAGTSYGKTLSFVTEYVGDGANAIPKTGGGCSPAGIILLGAGTLGCMLLRRKKSA